MQMPEKQENEFICKLIIKFIKFFKFMYSLSSKLLYLHTFCCITLHCIMCWNWLRNFYYCITKTFYDVFRLAFPWSFIKIYRSMVQMRQGSIVGLKKLKHVYHCIIFNFIECFFLVIFSFFSVTLFPVSCTGQDILSLFSLSPSLYLSLSFSLKNSICTQN